jgi:4-hydroxybenzoate polyprenyltransferase
MLETGIITEKGPHPIPALGRRRQVLVVDDNEGIRDLLSRALSIWGYDGTIAGNGIEAGKLFFTGSVVATACRGKQDPKGMTQQSGATHSAVETWRRAILHLRLPFSVILTPLFFWGVYLTVPAPIPWGRVLVGYLIVHVLLYGGMNAFNSYYDRDEGPIGALLDPPPVDRFLLSVALAFKAAALVGGLLLDLRFGLLIAIELSLSVLNSHSRWRWKEKPVLAATCIFVGQGVLGVLWGWTAATQPAAGLWPHDFLGSLGILGAASWTLGMYPLTGVCQIEGDRRRCMRTLAVQLGLSGSFRFAAVVTFLGGMGTIIVLASREAYVFLFIMALYLVGAVHYALRWYRGFTGWTARQNQQRLMRLSFWNGLTFTALFLVLLLQPSLR